MSTYRGQLKLLHEQTWFKTFIEAELKPGLPPAYESTVVESTDKTALEAMKQSALREGYRYCLAKFGVDV